MTSSRDERSLAGRRVLVVEDEYYIADDLARALARLGMEIVGPVPTCEQALRLLSARERINLAVLDINLKGEPVFPVADLLTERGVPFLFATGYGPADIPSRYQHVPRLEKPFDLKALAQALPDIM